MSLGISEPVKCGYMQNAYIAAKVRKFIGMEDVRPKIKYEPTFIYKKKPCSY